MMKKIKEKIIKEFDETKYFCLFLGWSRSGHSIVGSVLDAHPNIVITHEYDVLKYYKRNKNSKELFMYLLNKY